MKVSTHFKRACAWQPHCILWKSIIQSINMTCSSIWTRFIEIQRLSSISLQYFYSPSKQISTSADVVAGSSGILPDYGGSMSTLNIERCSEARILRAGCCFRRGLPSRGIGRKWQEASKNISRNVNGRWEALSGAICDIVQPVNGEISQSATTSTSIGIVKISQNLTNNKRFFPTVGR